MMIYLYQLKETKKVVDAEIYVRLNLGDGIALAGLDSRISHQGGVINHGDTGEVSEYA